MRIGIYARKSNDDPNVESVTRQIARSREAAAQVGGVIIEEYVCWDNEISGAEFVRRPGLAKIREGARRGAFDVVVTMEPERFGRDMIRSALFLRDLTEAGVRIYYYLAQQYARFDTAEDRLIAMFRGYASENERENARKRTRDALELKARNGRVTGGVVFGYRNVPVYSGTDTSGNPIREYVLHEIEPEEAEIIRGIFRMRAEGYGVRTIARALNGDAALTEASKRYFGGVRAQPPRSGSWAPASIHAMLRNERYLGRPTWGRFKNTDRGGRTRLRVRQDDTKLITVDQADLRIVDEAVWSAVRALDRPGEAEVRISGRGHNGNHTPTSLLSGLATCAKCRGPIRVAGSRKRERCYGCAYHHDRGSTVCENTLLESVASVDRRLIEEIECQLLVPEARRYITARAVQIVRERLAVAPEEVDRLRARLLETTREIQNLLTAIERRSAPQAVLDRIRQREQERADIEADLSRLERAAPVSELDEKRIEMLIGRGVARIGEQMQSDLARAKAALRAALTDRVTFRPTTTQRGAPTYQLEAPLAVGRLVTEAARTTVNVPDGIRTRVC
jgi:site-specific DNA recombinase